MTPLDAAGLVVIAARTRGVSTDAALAAMDVPAAQAALAEAGHFGERTAGREAVAVASITLVRALLRYRPFPWPGQQVAVTAGLQFLAVNGWRADLDPPETTAVVVEALASGQLAAADAAAWLSRRLTPAARPGHGPRAYRARLARPAVRRPGRGRPRPAVPAVRAAASALLAATVGAVAVLAAACSRAPETSPSPATGIHSARTFQAAKPGLAADLAYAACMRTHGIGGFPDPAPGGTAAIAPSAGIQPDSPGFRSAASDCHARVPSAAVRIVTSAS